MRSLFVSYRVLAIIVGVLLAFCSLVAMPLKYLAPDGGGLQTFGEQASIMWMLHGWVFIVYVVVAFMLARRLNWSMTFTVVMLIAGLVPLTIFWVERRVADRVRSERPELLVASS